MTKPNRIYLDLDLTFGLTATKDVAKRVDVNAVKQSLKNLLFIRKGEKPFRPEIGSDLYKILFEPMDFLTVDLLKDVIKDVIKKYEPRVNLQDIEINPKYDENLYDVILYFYVVGIYEPVTFNLTLQRLR
jgi:phage baseplate assembly protein W